MIKRRNVACGLSMALAILVVICAANDCSAADISGCWSGSWVSCKSGHKGPLNATICKIDETHYSAHFKGRFLKIVPFRYSVTLRVVEEGDVMKLQGSSYLGRIMGTFHYTAFVSGGKFDATYTSCKDHGKWVMTQCGSRGK